MSNETPRTMSMRYVLHGQDNDSVLDSESGIIIECGYNEDAELLRDQLNSYEERLQAERAAHAETRAKLAEAERDRDEARESVRYALNEGVPKLVATVKDGLDAIRATAEAKFAEYGRALAAAQAEVVALREALEGVVVAHPQAQRVDEHDAWMLGAARRLLSRAPGSLDALRALGEKVAFATKERGDEYERRYRLTGVPFNSADAQEIVARLLGEKDGAR